MMGVVSCSIEHVFKKIAFLQRKKFVRNCQIPSISPRLTVAIQNPKSTSTYVNEVCLLVHSNCKRRMEINCFSKPSICGEIINDLNYCLAYRFLVMFNLTGLNYFRHSLQSLPYFFHECVHSIIPHQHM